MAFYPCKIAAGGGGGGHTDVFMSGYFGSSSSERTLGTYTANEACTLKVTGLLAYTNCGNDDGYVELRKNGTASGQATAPTRTGTPLNVSSMNTLSLQAGDVVTLVGTWNNSHAAVTWYFAANLNIE